MARLYPSPTLSRPRTVAPDTHSRYSLAATSGAPLRKVTRWFALRSSSLLKTYISNLVLYRLLFNDRLVAPPAIRVVHAKPHHYWCSSRVRPADWSRLSDIGEPQGRTSAI